MGQSSSSAPADSSSTAAAAVDPPPTDDTAPAKPAFDWIATWTPTDQLPSCPRWLILLPALPLGLTALLLGVVTVVHSPARITPAVTLLFYGCTAVMAVCAIVALEPKTVPEWLHVRWPDWQELVLAAGLVVANLVVFVPLGNLIGAQFGMPVTMGVGGAALTPLLVFVVLAVVPCCEEALFRGFTIPYVGALTDSVRLAIAVSVALYGALHAPLFDAPTVVSAMLFGAGLSWLRIRERNLVGVMAAHVTTNAFYVFGSGALALDLAVLVG